MRTDGTSADAHARQAKDQELILWATEIKDPATRKVSNGVTPSIALLSLNPLPRWASDRLARVCVHALAQPHAGRQQLDARLLDKVLDEWKGVNPIHTLGGIQQMAPMSDQHLETTVECGGP